MVHALGDVSASHFPNFYSGFNRDSNNDWIETVIKRLATPALCAFLLVGCGGSGSGAGSETDIEIVIPADNSAGTDTEVVVGNNDTDTAGNNTDNVDATGSVDDTDVVDTGDTDTVGDTDTIGDTDTTATLVAPSGALDTAQPLFVWPAVAGAERYKIVVKDDGASGYARSLDPVAANCQTGEGMCSATTALAYFDNHLDWYVESTVNGAPGPVSDTYNITTPFSENMQPILSNTTDECEAWAAVAYDKYVVLNNAWNARVMSSDSWSQTINVTENSNGTVTPAWSYDWLGQFDTNTQFGEFEVKAYPEVLYGPKLGTHVSGTKEETGLPEQAANIPEFVVRYDFSETLDEDAERNVALESFFHDSDDIRGPCDFDENGNRTDNRVYEMMIWVNNPTIRTPGDLALTGVMVDNQLWNVYIKPRSNKHYIAFTAQTPTTSGTLNWKRFVDWTRDWTAANADALEIDVLEPDYYMGAIEIGTEMWWGSGSFTLNEFEVSF